MCYVDYLADFHIWHIPCLLVYLPHHRFISSHTASQNYYCSWGQEIVDLYDRSFFFNLGYQSLSSFFWTSPSVCMRWSTIHCLFPIGIFYKYNRVSDRKKVDRSIRPSSHLLAWCTCFLVWKGNDCAINNVFNWSSCSVRSLVKMRV